MRTLLAYRRAHAAFVVFFLSPLVLAEEHAAPADLLAARVRVVTDEGQPIADAKITPWARQCSNGHGMWQAGVFGGGGPPTVTTDEQGEASVPYPGLAIPELKIAPNVLTCRVEHEDFADTVYNSVPVPQSKGSVDTITLNPGAQVTLVALDENLEQTTEGVHVMWSDHSYWSSRSRAAADKSGKFRLPRLTPGAEIVRLVRLQDRVATHFSPALPMRLSNGDSIERMEVLAPAVTLNGVLSENVPRPVVNGRVKASIIQTSGDGFESIDWVTWAPIEEDGSFVLSGLPAEEPVQVIGLCDGFMACRGEPPPFATDRERKQVRLQTPQVFDLPAEGSLSVTLTMRPTCRCAFTIFDSRGEPLSNVEVHSWPNVHWWNNGNQIYCQPLVHSVSLMQNPGSSLPVEDEGAKRYGRPFSTVSGQNGRAVLENLPAGAISFRVTEGRGKTHRYAVEEGKLEVKPGVLNEKNVVLKLLH